LTQQLRELEAHGIVRRKVFHQVPPKVEFGIKPPDIGLLRRTCPIPKPRIEVQFRGWFYSDLREIRMLRIQDKIPFDPDHRTRHGKDRRAALQEPLFAKGLSSGNRSVPFEPREPFLRRQFDELDQRRIELEPEVNVQVFRIIPPWFTRNSRTASDRCSDP